MMSRPFAIRYWSALCCLFFLFACAVSAPSLEPTQTVMVPMRDGGHLATDYYLPEGEGPFPVVLARSVYGRAFGHDHLGPKMTGWGLALVIQDTRGRGDSEGKDMVFADDGWGARQDGFDTVAWIREQSWCNGKIGTWGGSALGLTQLLLAGSGAELQAQSIIVAASEFYGQLAYQGGVWRKALVETWLKGQRSEHVIDIWKAHPAYDAFWREGYHIPARAAHTTAPAIHMNGWFDIFAQGTIDNFLSRQYEGGGAARGNQFLIMGAWTHAIGGKAGEFKLPENAGFDLGDMERRLYGQFLLAEDADLDTEPRVRYYTLGDVERKDGPGNEWRVADTWPPFETRPTPLYLSGEGALVFETDNIVPAALAYTFDPANPVPTRGGQNLTIPAGPFDQRELGLRDDVLTFATAPLEAPMEITGRVTVELTVATDATDTDFTAKLVDIYPDGREMLMLDSIQRLKFRNGFETPAPATPGEPARVSIDLWSISLIVDTGHRIGLHISSSNYPRFEVNPNNGDDFPNEDNRQTATNTVFTGGDQPSALILPLRPQP